MAEQQSDVREILSEMRAEMDALRDENKRLLRQVSQRMHVGSSRGPRWSEPRPEPDEDPEDSSECIVLMSWEGTLQRLSESWRQAKAYKRTRVTDTLHMGAIGQHSRLYVLVPEGDGIVLVGPVRGEDHWMEQGPHGGELMTGSFLRELGHAIKPLAIKHIRKTGEKLGTIRLGLC